MKLYFCAIITLLEMLDASFSNALVGEFIETFQINFIQIPILYISLSVGACLSIPLAKYFYNTFPLKAFYSILFTVLSLDFAWAFFTTNWHIFCILRFIQGLVLTLIYTLSFLDAMNNSLDKDKDLNLINSISIIGIISGPALSGLVSIIAWKSIFILFELITIGLFFMLAKLDFNNLKASVYKIGIFDIMEYIIFALLLSLGSLLFDGILGIKYTPILIILVIAIIFKYKKFNVNFIFNKEVFNYNLLKVTVIHFLFRLSIIGLIPLLVSVLSQNYHFSTLKISFLLILAGVASLCAKTVYKHPTFIHQWSIVVFFAYMGILSIFALSPFKHIWFLDILFFMFGFTSSIIFNYANSSIYLKQEKEYCEDLSLILTNLQMLLYGLCISCLFHIFSLLNHTFEIETSMAITIAFLVYFTSLGVYIYQINFNLRNMV